MPLAISVWNDDDMWVDSSSVQSFILGGEERKGWWYVLNNYEGVIKAQIFIPSLYLTLCNTIVYNFAIILYGGLILMYIRWVRELRMYINVLQYEAGGRRTRIMNYESINREIESQSQDFSDLEATQKYRINDRQCNKIVKIRVIVIYFYFVDSSVNHITNTNYNLIKNNKEDHSVLRCLLFYYNN